MNRLAVNILGSLLVIAFIGGCSAKRTFTKTAVPGETVTLAIGWYPDLRRENLTITFTPATGPVVQYLPGDPAVRAVANMYPDPLSKLQVEREIGISPVNTDAGLLEAAVTGGDKEYSEKLIMLDLPPGLSTGMTVISIASATGETINDVKVEIVPGLTNPNGFGNWNGWAIDDSHLKYMERPPYYAVEFTGSPVPHAIQIDLVHNPDAGSGGTGVPYVVNPRGDLKSVAWSDDGTQTRVILTPTGTAGLANIKHFKFYVAGGLTGVILGPVSGYDINGDPVAVSADITAY